MTATLSPSASRCPRCGSTDRQIRKQTFKDGTTHNREECCDCRHFFRYAPRREIVRHSLPVAPSTPPPPRPAPALPASSDLLGRAQSLLTEVAQRANELRQHRPADAAAMTALYGAAQAASATLSPENINNLATAVRAGKLPRKGV